MAGYGVHPHSNFPVFADHQPGLAQLSLVQRSTANTAEDPIVVVEEGGGREEDADERETRQWLLGQ